MRVYYGAVLKMASGQPVLITSSELATGWSSANELMYTLPAELIARLDGLAATAAGETNDDGDDDGDEAVNEEEEEEAEEGGGDRKSVV